MKSEQAIPASSPEACMQTYVNAMQPGWNLGNSLDAIGPDETAWGNPIVTETLIQQIAAQGFRSIRIPVTWKQHTGSAPNYTVSPAWMNRVQQIVDWSLNAGLYVMINVHHDSWVWVNTLGNNKTPVLDEFHAVWTQIANRFKDYPNALMFESINEPKFDPAPESETALLHELFVNFHNFVRGTGGGNAARPLVLPTVLTSSQQHYLDALRHSIVSLNDPNLIATIHYYGYWPFSVNIAGKTKFDMDSINDIHTTLEAVYNTLVANGIPVVIGEYGLLGFDKRLDTVEHGEILKFFEYYLQYAQSKNMASMLWDNGQHFNRTACQWSDPELYNVIIHSLTGRSSTLNTDLIFLKKGETIGDVSLNLSLNGNHFVSLKNGSSTLATGRDYTINGDVLTVKAGYLSNYASGAFGEKGVLTANFSSGPDWNIYVRYYDAPSLSMVSGTTDSFEIPAAFNGDLLATMEAVYVGGGNAGPADWTSFQEFSQAYAHDYANNRIKISPFFFASTKDGDVTLTFHFWSGQIVNYTIAKEGTNVECTSIRA